MLWMPVAKFGWTDRSAKSASDACSTILLMAIGIGAEAGAAAASCRAALGGAPLAAAALLRAGGGTMGAVAATGAPPEAPGTKRRTRSCQYSFHVQAGV